MRAIFFTFVEMKKFISFSVFQFCIALLFLCTAAGIGQTPETEGWRAGIARAIITPEEPMWMAGYASRNHPSEGTLVDLWAKVLALEDAKREKVVLITTDLLGFPKNISDRIRDQIGVQYGLKRAQIILSSSHTHTGPVLTDALADIYSFDEKQAEIILNYSNHLEKKIVDLTGVALRSMVPARIFSGNGITRFQVNRRHNAETTLTAQTELTGPNDYAVPVLKVTDSRGNLLTVAFGYACHATVLKIYRFSGDYPGFAQIEIETMYPGATAMFFQGAGADQNPLPRGTISLAQQYGRELASAVDRVLKEDMKELEPSISNGYSEFALTFATILSKEALEKMEHDSTGYKKRWAARQLETLRTAGKLPESYPSYPVQIWKLGDQPLMVLGGEIVVQYAIELKKLFGPELFVIGYANDEMGYIPSETVLSEGGYEGDFSHMVYGMPGKWSAGIQVKILNEIKKLAEITGVNQVTKNSYQHDIEPIRH